MKKKKEKEKKKNLLPWNNSHTCVSLSLDIILFRFSFGKSCNNDSHKKYNFLVASLVCLFDCLCVFLDYHILTYTKVVPRS